MNDTPQTNTLQIDEDLKKAKGSKTAYSFLIPIGSLITVAGAVFLVTAFNQQSMPHNNGSALIFIFAAIALLFGALLAIGGISGMILAAKRIKKLQNEQKLLPKAQ
jgi:TRAP-type mannitol/chloroaromatic compound transport system permease small subunit